jgi:hypothetical protein
LTLVRQSRTHLELDAERKALIYRTSVGSSFDGVTLEPATVRGLESIVWDHSAMGPSVTCERRPRVSVTLEDGVYEFRALTVVARRFPALAAPALRHAVTG